MTELQGWLVDWVDAGLAREPWRTQGWLARRAGISEKHLSQMLQGKSQGTLALWDRLLYELGVRDEALSSPATASALRARVAPADDASPG